MVLPNMAFIDEIKAVSYDICGVVQMVTGNSKAKVALIHGPENVKPQMKLTDENGSFCFELIYLTGKKYLLKGLIHIDSTLLQDSFDKSESIIVDIFDRANVHVDTVNAIYVSEEVEQNGAAIYEYTMWSDLGEEFIIIPRYSSEKQDKKILFYPREHKVSVTVDGCQSTIPLITGRMGLYLEGSVSPPLSGVNIRIIAAEECINAPLHKGDLAITTETGPDGSFIAGPLYDDTTYSIEAAKPGYHVKQLGHNSFTCQKLSQIVVNIYDKGESKELFPSVLLSLSGEDAYRNNSISGAGGAFSFDNLFPGSFYLRPLLKEYSFSPPAAAIELDSGESKVVVFHATCVAYRYCARGDYPRAGGRPS